MPYLGYKPEGITSCMNVRAAHLHHSQGHCDEHRSLNRHVVVRTVNVQQVAIVETCCSCHGRMQRILMMT